MKKTETMKYNYKKWLFILSLLFSENIFSQQIFVNKEWEFANGIHGQYDYVSTALDPLDNIIVTGNHSNGNHCDIFTNCITGNGQNGWQQINTGVPNQDHYGSDVVVDNAGFIYVCGAVHNGNNYDYRINKYSSSGNLLWQQDYNGTGNADDVATAIALDDSGNIYVTGTSFGVNSSTDFATLKFDNNGSLLWTIRYNFNNNPEVAIDIIIDNAGDVIVAGTSANNLFNSDFTVVKYNSVTGNQTAVKRHNSPGNGYDVPSEIGVDASNNIFLIGTANSNTTNKDIKLIAYNSSLVVQWVQYIDRSGSSDEGFGICVDNNGNILIAGYSTKSSGGTDFVTAKYNSTNGSQEWINNKSALVDSQIAKARKVRCDNNGNLYVVGDADLNGSRDLVVVSYDGNGNIRWEKSYDNPDNGTDRAAQLVVTDDAVYATAISNDGTTDRTNTIKFTTKGKPFNPVFVNGEPSHNDDEIIIRFDKQALITSTIDKVEFEAGILADFVKPEYIQLMEQQYPNDWKNAPTYKIFLRMTTADTISETRTGSFYRMPDHWATLSVFLKTDLSEQMIADTLTAMDDTIIHFAHLNHLFERNYISNDPLLSVTNEQEALVPTATYPAGHIFMDNAWNYSVGEWHTKVGVFDDPIYWAHEDFGDGTFSGSKIEGGWDYFNNIHISSVLSPGSSHGTSCAGIIGALRNNNTGIAGIAGGDFSNGNLGVQLFSLGIFSSGTFTSTATAAAAIVEGASYNPSTGYGYGLSIQNHSWSGSSLDPTVESAVTTCWRNHCVFVASRGNDGNSNFLYPGCYSDYAVLNTGASGTDGSYKSFTNGDSWWESSYGGNVDFIAPGTTEIVTSLINPVQPYVYPNGCSSSSYINYQCFNGTSSAAPHVSGVAALMYSRHHPINGAPNTLATEDIENILQKTASDKGAPGYDQFNGWGLINAYDAVVETSYPIFYVKHSPNVTPSQTIAANLNVIVSSYMYGVAAGQYVADRYQLNWTYVDVLPATDQIIDWWTLEANTVRGVSAVNPIDGTLWMNVTPTVSGNAAVFSVLSFSWLIKTSITGQNVNKWIPAPPSSLKYGYSLHVRNTSINSVEETENNISTNLFPNPTNETANLSFTISVSQNVRLELYDIAGKLIASPDLGNKAPGQHTFTINLSNVESGVYFCKLFIGDSVVTQRIVKQ